MGNNTKVLLTAAWLLSLLLSVVMVLGQFEPAGPVGKPCSSSFHCWRTEPVNVLGEPEALQQGGSRRKRLEIGGSASKGGRCRCVEGSCALFLHRFQSFLPCEEF
uniref:Uncharacterized protein n=1 Tax=Caenorhabditis japonica TaxID=281687 RepID=A0A8R1HRS6_CAEJA